MRATYPTLAGAVPAEVANRILEVIPGAAVNVSPGIVVESDVQTQAQIDAALAGWSPTSTGVDPMAWSAGVPAYLAPHIAHLRDFRAAVRSGQSPTLAQTQHVLADAIDAIRYLNSRATGD